MQPFVIQGSRTDKMAQNTAAAAPAAVATAATIAAADAAAQATA